MSERVIVYATELEGDPTAGLALATELAAERVATLLILHVEPLRTDRGEGMLHDAVGLVSGHARQRLRALIPPDPSVPYLHVLRVGEPETVILDVAAEEQAELLVVEERPRRRLSRRLSRSLAERIAVAAPCPVVVYRQGAVRAAGLNLTPEVPALRHPIEALDLLSGLLESRVDAVVSYLDHKRDIVARLGALPSLRDGIAALVRSPGIVDARSASGRVRNRVSLELDEHQRALMALGVELSTPDGALFRRGLTAVRDEGYAAFAHQLATEGGAVSLPLDGQGGRPGSLVILAGTVLDLEGLGEAALVFTFDARRDFLRILAQPGPTPSTETYAFDRDGLMLSNSRFPADLRRLGLLPEEPGAQAPRRLRVRDPSGPSLTRAAADAVSGHDGSDWRGYPDYRGIEVVGVWKWVARHAFGVAAEMDRASLCFDVAK